MLVADATVFRTSFLYGDTSRWSDGVIGGKNIALVTSSTVV